MPCFVYLDGRTRPSRRSGAEINGDQEVLPGGIIETASAGTGFPAGSVTLD
jgi:hypothetical protein